MSEAFDFGRVFSFEEHARILRESVEATPPPPEWVDCPTCWAAGRIYEQHGGAWAVEICPSCLGVGQVGRRRAA